MIRNDMDAITDDKFDNVVLPCRDKIINYIKNNILDEYVAYNIATYYKNDAIWNEPFELQIISALEDLAQLNVSDCNIQNIKNILKTKHHLNVISDDPIIIDEI